MNNKGLSIIGIVVGVVVLAAVVVGVVYLTSDVWRTKIDSAAEGFAKWTPENIAKDPENYLNFCEKQAKKALLDLKANKISIAQSRGKLQGMKEDANNKVTLGEQTVVELKDLYKKTDTSKAWPVSWKGQDRDQDWMKRQIISLHQQVVNQKSILGKVEDGIKKLQNQDTKVLDAEAKTQEQLTMITANREVLKVQKITDDLTKRLVDMKSVLQATVSTASETSGTISLDQLAADNASAVDEKAFDKIMADSK